MFDASKSTRIGDILVERAIISRAQLLQALDLQQTRCFLGGPASEVHREIGEILIELGFISREQLRKNLARQSRLRKTTLAFTLVAPLFTMACGGGGGASASTNAKPAQAASSAVHIDSSLAVSPPPPVSGVGIDSVSAGAKISSSMASSMAAIQSSAGLTPVPPLGAAPAPVPAAPKSLASSKGASLSSLRTSVASSRLSSSSVKPSSSSRPSSSAKVSSSVKSSSSLGLSSSTPSSRMSSSSKSSAPPSSSARSFASSNSSKVTSSLHSSQTVNGPVVLYWTAPTRRMNGAHLDISQIGGYEVRYKLRNESKYTYITIPNGYTDAYYFDYLNGDYVFEIAAFDVTGLYSRFVTVNPVE